MARPDLQRLTDELPVADAPEATGAVRWFSDEKGYGFIVPDDGSEDVFVRFSAIAADGFRALASGQRVRYRVVSDARGPRALDVHVVRP